MANGSPNPVRTWFAVRCVFRIGCLDPPTYEERITLWQAFDFDEAIALAEDEAESYVRLIGDADNLGLAEAYHLVDEPRHGAEVFSLMRDSPLSPEDYVATFFTTGAERTQVVGETNGED